MDEVLGVEIRKGQSYVVAEVDLGVVRQGLFAAIEKLREALIHEFHQNDGEAGVRVGGCPKVLDYVGVLHLAEEAALLFEFLGVVGGAGIVHLEEDRVQEFGCTGKLVTHRPAHDSVGPSPQWLGLEQLDLLVVFERGLACHDCVCWRVRERQVVSLW